MTTHTLYEINLPELLVAITLTLPVFMILWVWQLQAGRAIHALIRMLIQLLIMGYCLNYLFASESSLLVLTVILAMVILSGWISLSHIGAQRSTLINAAVAAIGISGGLTLLVVTQFILPIDPWYSPRYLIPLAGMIFANTLTSISLAAERMYAEIQKGETGLQVRSAAFNASLIPVINSLFATGLVSLPGMMTGQILSGISPLIAARYQIVVMCMVFSAAGTGSAIFLTMARKHYDNS